MLEGLEGRSLLATFNWVSPTSGDFGDSANWRESITNLPGVPGAGDTANIGGGIQATSSVSRTVNNLVGFGSLHVTGGNFTLQNGGFDSQISLLVLDTGTTLTTAGGTTAIIGAEISGSLNTLTGATFRFQRGVNNLNVGSSLLGAGQYLMLGDVFGAPVLDLKTNTTSPARFHLDNGEIRGTSNLTIPGIFDWDSSSTAAMSGTGQTIVQAGATLNIAGSAGSLVQRAIVNSGTIAFTATSNFNLAAGAAIINQVGSVLDVHTDRSIVGGQSLTITNAGTIRKTSGNGNSLIGVRLLNTGSINVQSGTLTLTGGVGTAGTYSTLIGTALDLTGGGQFELGGVCTFQGNGTVLTGSGILTTASTGGTWVVPPSVTMIWTSNLLGIGIGSTLNFNGNLNFAGSTATQLFGGGKLKMNGNLTHSGSGDIVMTGDSATNSVATTLEIPVGRSYLIQSNGGISASGAGGIILNAGTINKTAGTGTSRIIANVNNTGTIRTTAGTLSLNNTTATAGVLTAGASSTLQLIDNNLGQFLFTGNLTITGAGVISISAGNFRVGSAGGTLNVGATSHLVWSGGNFSVPVGATATINGNLEISATSTVILGGGGSAVFNGITTQTGLGDLRIDGDGFNAPSTLRIPAGKTFAIANDSGLIQGVGGSGRIDNLGLIRKTSGAGVSRLSQALLKPANLQVDIGTLQLGSSGSVVQGGNFTVATGAVIDLTSNVADAITYSGTFTGAGGGQVQLNRGALVVANGGGGTTFNFPSGLLRWLGGVIDTNASILTVFGSMSFEGAGSVAIVGIGRVQVSGNFDHLSTGNLALNGSTTLAIGATGIYNLRKNSSIVGTGTIENSGVIRKNGGTAVSSLSTAITNSGTVESRLGTLNVSGPIFEIVGTTLTGGTWSVFGTTTNTATLNLNANIATIGFAAKVNISGPNASIPSIASLTSVVGQLQLLAGANFASAGSLTNSGKILVSATSIFDVNGNFTQSPQANLTLQMSNSSIGRMRTLGTGTANLGGTLTIAFTGTPPAIGSSVTIIENQSSNPTNGTFAGLPQNAVLSFGGMTWRIRYNQGTGNDVTLLRLT